MSFARILGWNEGAVGHLDVLVFDTDCYGRILGLNDKWLDIWTGKV